VHWFTTRKQSGPAAAEQLPVDGVHGGVLHLDPGAYTRPLFSSICALFMRQGVRVGIV